MEEQLLDIKEEVESKPYFLIVTVNTDFVIDNIGRLKGLLFQAHFYNKAISKFKEVVVDNYPNEEITVKLTNSQSIFTSTRNLSLHNYFKSIVEAANKRHVINFLSENETKNIDEVTEKIFLNLFLEASLNNKEDRIQPKKIKI